MSGTSLKVAIGVFFMWLSAQMGTFVDEILVRVQESLQATELLEIDNYVYLESTGDGQRRKRPPRDQADFEEAVQRLLEARGRSATRDRWNQPYVYFRIPRGDSRDIWYQIASKGPDRKPGTADDIVVVREESYVRINRNPAEIAEQAIERKRQLDRESLQRIRQLLEAAKPGAPSEKETPKELESATHDLGRLLEES